MKLKTFDKAQVNVETEYTVFTRSGEYETSFTVNYLKVQNIHKLQQLIDRGADVMFISAHPNKPGILCVSVRV